MAGSGWIATELYWTNPGEGNVAERHIDDG
jgi:hypothetical protein